MLQDVFGGITDPEVSNNDDPLECHDTIIQGPSRSETHVFCQMTECIRTGHRVREVTMVLPQAQCPEWSKIANSPFSKHTEEVSYDEMWPEGVGA